MKEKLAILKKLRSSKNNFKSATAKKLIQYVINTYIIECICKENDNFKLTFKGRYINSFVERVMDWFFYILDSIYRFYLVHFTPDDDKTFKKYELIHCGAEKPVHLKISNTPNEQLLEIILKENGFKIVNEHLDSINAIYNIAKI